MGRRGWNVLNLDPDAGDVQVHVLIFHGVTRVWVLRGYLYHSSFKKKPTKINRETIGSGQAGVFLAGEEWTISSCFMNLRKKMGSLPEATSGEMSRNRRCTSPQAAA